MGCRHRTAPFDRIWSSPIVVDGTLIIGSASFQVFVAARRSSGQRGRPRRRHRRRTMARVSCATLRAMAFPCGLRPPSTRIGTWPSSAPASRTPALPVPVGLARAIDYRTGESPGTTSSRPATRTRSRTRPDPTTTSARHPTCSRSRPLVGVGDKGQYKAFDRERRARRQPVPDHHSGSNHTAINGVTCGRPVGAHRRQPVELRPFQLRARLVPPDRSGVGSRVDYPTGAASVR